VRIIGFWPLLAACHGTGDSGDTDAFVPMTALDVATLSNRGACGDAVFYASNAEHSVMLYMNVDTGLALEATNTGEVQTASYTLPDAQIEVRLDQGIGVDDATCDDVVEGAGPQVLATWSAISGSVAVTVTPRGDYGSDADAQLVGAELSGDSGTLTVDRLEWTDVFVGWYPG
jgi:hypothetical protein